MLTNEQEQLVKDMFAHRATLKRGSKEDLSYREYIASTLTSMFQFFIETCKTDWYNKYKIDKSDSESLLMYSLLRAIDSYGLRRTRAEQRRIDQRRKELTIINRNLRNINAKEGNFSYEEKKLDYIGDIYSFGRYLKKPSSSFTTYFWTICNNDLANFIKARQRTKTNPHIYVEKNVKVDKNTGELHNNCKYESEDKNCRQCKTESRWLPIFVSPVSMDYYYYSEDHDETSNQNTLENKISLNLYQRNMLSKEQEDVLGEIFASSSFRNKRILFYLYNGVSVAEIQKKVNLSKQAVYNVLKQVRKRFSRLL